MHSIEDLLLKLAKAIRPVVETHMHWHLSNNQTESIKALDEVITALETAYQTQGSEASSNV